MERQQCEIKEISSKQACSTTPLSRLNPTNCHILNFSIDVTMQTTICNSRVSVRLTQTKGFNNNKISQRRSLFALNLRCNAETSIDGYVFRDHFQPHLRDFLG